MLRNIIAPFHAYQRYRRLSPQWEALWTYQGMHTVRSRLPLWTMLLLHPFCFERLARQRQHDIDASLRQLGLVAINPAVERFDFQALPAASGSAPRPAPTVPLLRMLVPIAAFSLLVGSVALVLHTAQHLTH